MTTAQEIFTRGNTAIEDKLTEWQERAEQFYEDKGIENAPVTTRILTPDEMPGPDDDGFWCVGILQVGDHETYLTWNPDTGEWGGEELS